MVPGAADWDLGLRVAARYPFAAVPSPQILYRISGSSMSSSVNRQATECMKVLDRAFDQAPESLQQLRNPSLANLYQYFTVRALEGPPARSRSVVAARFLWQAIRYNPSVLSQRTKLMSILFAKILVGILLPAKQAQVLFQKFRSRSQQ